MQAVSDRHSFFGCERVGGGSKVAASVGIWVCFAAIPAVNCRRCATADGGVSDSRALE